MNRKALVGAAAVVAVVAAFAGTAVAASSSHDRDPDHAVPPALRPAPP